MPKLLVTKEKFLKFIFKGAKKKRSKERRTKKESRRKKIGARKARSYSTGERTGWTMGRGAKVKNIYNQFGIVVTCRY